MKDKPEEAIENLFDASVLDPIQLNDFIQEHPELLESYLSLKRKLEINSDKGTSQPKFLLDENEKRMLLLFNEYLKTKIDALDAKIAVLKEKMELSNDIIQNNTARIYELEIEITNSERKYVMEFMKMVLFMSFLGGIFVFIYGYIQYYLYGTRFSDLDILGFTLGIACTTILLNYKDVFTIINLIRKNRDRDRSQ